MKVINFRQIFIAAAVSWVISIPLWYLVRRKYLLLQSGKFLVARFGGKRLIFLCGLLKLSAAVVAVVVGGDGGPLAVAFIFAVVVALNPS